MFIFFGESHRAAIFEDNDQRFFAQNTKMTNLELGGDGFFNSDPNPEIFKSSAKNRQF